MANVTCIYKDKNGVEHVIRKDNMVAETSCRLIKEGKISLSEQRRRVHEMRKEEREYDER